MTLNYLWLVLLHPVPSLALSLLIRPVMKKSHEHIMSGQNISLNPLLSALLPFLLNLIATKPTSGLLCQQLLLGVSIKAAVQRVEVFGSLPVSFR